MMIIINVNNLGSIVNIIAMITAT